MTPYPFAASPRDCSRSRVSNSLASGGIDDVDVEPLREEVLHAREAREPVRGDDEDAPSVEPSEGREDGPQGGRLVLRAGPLLHRERRAPPRERSRLIGACCGARASTGGPDEAPAPRPDSRAAISRSACAISATRFSAFSVPVNMARRAGALLREDVEGLEHRERVARERDARREGLVERQDGRLVSGLDRADDEVLQRAEEARAPALVAERQAVDEEDDAPPRPLGGRGGRRGGGRGRGSRGCAGRRLVLGEVRDRDRLPADVKREVGRLEARDAPSLLVRHERVEVHEPDFLRGGDAPAEALPAAAVAATAGTGVPGSSGSSGADAIAGGAAPPAAAREHDAGVLRREPERGRVEVLGDPADPLRVQLAAERGPRVHEFLRRRDAPALAPRRRRRPVRGATPREARRFPRGTSARRRPRRGSRRGGLRRRRGRRRRRAAAGVAARTNAPDVTVAARRYWSPVRTASSTQGRTSSRWPEPGVQSKPCRRKSRSETSVGGAIGRACRERREVDHVRDAGEEFRACGSSSS